MNAIGIAGGEYHTCILLDNGGVACWGWNGDGQLGIGNTDNVLLPTSVEFGTGNLQCNLIFKYKDLLFDMFRVSLLSYMPTDASATFLAAGGHQTCVVLVSMLILCWGDGELLPMVVDINGALNRHESGAVQVFMRSFLFAKTNI